MLDRIRKVLEVHDGMCLDDEKERDIVARAVTNALLGKAPVEEEDDAVKLDHKCPECGSRPNAFSGRKDYKGGEIVGLEGDFTCGNVDCQFQWSVVEGSLKRRASRPAIRDNQKRVRLQRPVEYVVPRTWYAIVKKENNEILAMFGSSDMCSDVLYGESEGRPSYFDERVHDFDHVTLKEVL